MKDEYRKLFGKEDAIPPRVLPAKYRGHEDFFSCRNCGYDLGRSRVTSENYCANCGQRIKHYAYGGTYCWTEKEAEKEWHRMLKERMEQNEAITG